MQLHHWQNQVLGVLIKLLQILYIRPLCEIGIGDSGRDLNIRKYFSDSGVEGDQHRTRINACVLEAAERHIISGGCGIQIRMGLPAFRKLRYGGGAVLLFPVLRHIIPAHFIPFPYEIGLEMGVDFLFRNP